MASVSIDELIRRLETAAEGGYSRSEAAAWARAYHPGYGGSNPFRNTTGSEIAQLAELALGALAVADLSEVLAPSRPSEPYFIRDYDLREWIAVVQQQDYKKSHPQGIFPKRFHQVRPAPIVFATLSVSPHSVSEQLALPSLRGRDDFDYFDLIFFDNQQGKQILLEWYVHCQSQDATLLLETGVDPNAVLRDLLCLLELNELVVTWQQDGLVLPTG